LGAWVSQQRHFQKAGKLSAEKERLLTEIGFARALQQSTAHGVNRHGTIGLMSWFNTRPNMAIAKCQREGMKIADSEFGSATSVN
jgi:hypothetical protein